MNKQGRLLLSISLAVVFIAIGYLLKPQVIAEDLLQRLNSPENDLPQKPDDVADQDWRLFKAMHKKLKAASVPIVFYGRVVDQDDNPIERAAVIANVTYYGGFSLAMLRNMDPNYKRKKLRLVTDALGRFKIDGVKGQSLDLKINKEGYVTSQDRNHYDYDPQETNLLHHPNSEKPVIFRLWKKGAAAELLEGEARLFIEADDPNRVYTVSLLDGERYPGVSDQGDVIVDGFSEGRGRDPETRRFLRSEYDWSVKLTIQGGGLHEANGHTLLLAPESGYQETIEFSMSEHDPKWRSFFDAKGYYFKDRSGNYGSFLLDVDARFDGKVIVRFKNVRKNPTGSRNLQSSSDGDTGLSPEVVEWIKAHGEEVDLDP